MVSKASKNLAAARKQELLKALKQLGQATYEEVDSGRFPQFTFPSRSVSNIVYDPKLKQYILGKTSVKRSAGNIKHIRPFTQLLWLAFFADKLVNEGKTSTLRDVYYSSQAYNMEFVDQAESDEIITDLEAVLSRAREELKIYPEERSAIFGDLTIEYTVPGYEGNRLNLSSHPDGYLIGPSLSSAEFVDTSAEMIIAVEKGGIFTRFVEEKVHKKYKAILIDTAGQPPRSTRFMLKRLNKELNLPVYIMSDGDVYGEHIAMVIISGSANAAHLRELTVSTAKWVGVWASVTGDEPVIIQKNGLLRNMEIGKFYSETQKMVEKQEAGFYPATAVSAFCCSDSGEVGIKPIKALMRHSYDGDIYKIRTKGGFTVKTTGNHSVQRFNRDTYRLESIPVTSLKKGDLLASCFGIPNSENLNEINFASLIAQEAPHLANNIFVEGVEAKQLSDFLWQTYSKKEMRKNYYQVLKRGENGVKLSYFFAQGKIPNQGFLRLRYSKNKIPVCVKDILRFARLMGYYAAEGGLSKGKRGSVCELTFSIHEMDYVRDSCDCIKESLSIQPSAKERTINNTYRIRYGNTLLAQIYSEVLGTGKRVERKQVPFIFFNVVTDAKREFLRGYFRGDRIVNYSEETRLGATTVSRKLAADLVVLLRQLGVVAYVWKHGSSYIVSCADTVGIQDIFNEICRKPTVVRSKIVNVPRDLVYDLGRELKSAIPYGQKSDFHRKVMSGGETINVGYGRFGKAVSLIQMESQSDHLRTMNSFIQNKVALLPVTEITNMGRISEPVYDIEVDNVHTFVGGVGGLVLHNSDIVKYKLPTDPMTEADIKRAQELRKDPRYTGGVWQRELDIFLKIKRKSELEAFSKYGLTFIVDNYLKEKMAEAKSL